MKLRKLIQGVEHLQVFGSQEVEIRNLTSNSNQAFPGSLFISYRGAKYDGADFSSEAVRSGAVALLSTAYNPFLSSVTQLVHPDVKKITPILAARFFEDPSRKLFLVGITGTNGKTTTSYLVRHLLNPCGLIGTIEWTVGSKVLPATHTTPDLITNLKLLHDMVQSGCRSAVMEVSSHGLDQGRVDRLSFKAAVFTNLTQDHLDYHKTMERYADAKALLFTALDSEAFAIYNRDDPWHEPVLKQTKAQKFSFGVHPQSDLRLLEWAMEPKGLRCSLIYQGEQYQIHSPLAGRFNIYNIMAAIGVALAAGKSWDEIQTSLAHSPSVPGRLERVENKKGIHVFIDYAHTEDALRKTLETLQEIRKQKIITVFGCGGDRDRAKRPKMASVAEALSDFVVVTTDNPRSEEPAEIIHEIQVGFQKKLHAIEVDRFQAIQKAIGLAQPGDIVLIAGKGHEKTQVMKWGVVPFDDAEVAHKSLF